eukprot:3895851-Rhodomonas_salina.1
MGHNGHWQGPGNPSHGSPSPTAPEIRGKGLGLSHWTVVRASVRIWPGATAVSNETSASRLSR